jgi:hypothetical protein
MIFVAVVVSFVVNIPQTMTAVVDDDESDDALMLRKNFLTSHKKTHLLKI